MMRMKSCLAQEQKSGGQNVPDNEDNMLFFEGHECEYGCFLICEYPEEEYIGREIIDEKPMYPWNCTQYGVEGCEVFQPIYDGHNVNTKDMTPQIAQVFQDRTYRLLDENDKEETMMMVEISEATTTVVHLSFTSWLWNILCASWPGGMGKHRQRMNFHEYDKVYEDTFLHMREAVFAFLHCLKYLPIHLNFSKNFPWLRKKAAVLLNKYLIVYRLVIFHICIPL